MTNFSSNNQKFDNILTPENAVLFVPIILSLILCIFGSFFILKPLLKRTQSINDELITYNEKKENLLIQRKRLDDLNKKLEKAKSQKKFIIKLIGGTNDLDTLISKLNKLSNKNSLIVKELEPQVINSYKPPIIVNTESDPLNSSLIPEYKISESTRYSPEPLPESSDPLLTPELEQHVISLTLQGNFREVLSFLRDIELIENIILTSNIKFEKINKNQNELKNNNVNSKKVNTNFSTTLSAYGRI